MTGDVCFQSMLLGVQNQRFMTFHMHLHIALLTQKKYVWPNTAKAAVLGQDLCHCHHGGCQDAFSG